MLVSATLLGRRQALIATALPRIVHPGNRYRLTFSSLRLRSVKCLVSCSYPLGWSVSPLRLMIRSSAFRHRSLPAVPDFAAIFHSSSAILTLLTASHGATG